MFEYKKKITFSYTNENIKSSNLKKIVNNCYIKLENFNDVIKLLNLRIKGNIRNKTITISYDFDLEYADIEIDNDNSTEDIIEYIMDCINDTNDNIIDLLIN